MLVMTVFMPTINHRCANELQEETDTETESDSDTEEDAVSIASSGIVR